MIPDFPELKKKIDQYLIDYMKNRISHYQGILNEITSYRHFEGNHTKVISNDVDMSIHSYTEISAPFEIKNSEAHSLTLRELLEIYDDTARELVRQQNEHLLKSIFSQKTTDNSQSLPELDQLDKETWIKVITDFKYSFDRDGNVNLPAILVPKEYLDEVKEKISNWMEDPEVKKTFDLTVDAQRINWNAEKANRKLVD